MILGTRQLTDCIAAGATEPGRVRVWARAARPGTYSVSIRSARGPVVAECPIELDPGVHDGTGAIWLAGLSPRGRYRAQLRRDGDVLSDATFRTPPQGREDAPRRWSFGAMSCHQPFDERGRVDETSVSMLRAARRAYEAADIQFLLMMGDQTYSDLPEGYSLFDDAHFQRVAPDGRETILDCTAAEIRRLYQDRHRSFWGCEEFDRLVRMVSGYCMPDDHELVDNFGSDPEHRGPRWHALRDGALDAFFDHQGSRVLARDRSTGARPSRLDWGFRWGPAAVWGLDVRSNRITHGDQTTVFSAEQHDAMRTFFETHVDAALLVVMAPIPLVHVDRGLVAKVGAMLGTGSDLHERWVHPQCKDARAQFVSLLLAQAKAAPHQRIVLVGGDVHAGAASCIDFADEGAQLLQFTSSALSNRQSWLAEVASGRAAPTATSLDVGDGRCGDVSLLSAKEGGISNNPYGGLNAGIVDVFDHGEEVAVGFRLIGHDGAGNPVTKFDTGELGRRRDPARRLSAVDELVELPRD